MKCRASISLFLVYQFVIIAIMRVRNNPNVPNFTFALISDHMPYNPYSMYPAADRIEEIANNTKNHAKFFLILSIVLLLFLGAFFAKMRYDLI